MDTLRWDLLVQDADGKQDYTRQLVACCQELTTVLRALSAQSARIGESEVALTANRLRIKVKVHGPDVRAAQVVSTTIRRHGLLALPAPVSV